MYTSHICASDSGYSSFVTLVIAHDLLFFLSVRSPPLILIVVLERSSDNHDKEGKNQESYKNMSLRIHYSNISYLKEMKFLTVSTLCVKYM